MKKIPSVFLRDLGTHFIYNEVTPGCEWVLAGEGVATRKFDGTACMIRHGNLFKRYDAKKNGKTPPLGFEPSQEPDEKTGHYPGWVPVTLSDRYHLEAFNSSLSDGTYELCGPKVNGNPERLEAHTLLRHGLEVYLDVPRTFLGLQIWLEKRTIEGIVFWHDDGRMAKVKKKDFATSGSPPQK